jgi:hypothetical protein
MYPIKNDDGDVELFVLFDTEKDILIHSRILNTAETYGYYIGRHTKRAYRVLVNSRSLDTSFKYFQNRLDMFEELRTFGVSVDKIQEYLAINEWIKA